MARSEKVSLFVVLGICLHLILVQALVDPRQETCEFLDPEMQNALREDLRENNCLQEVEAVAPNDTLRAKRLFHRDGYVVVRDLVKPDILAGVKERMTRLVEEILEKDPQRIGNRGPYRYSFGPVFKTGHMLHIPEIAQLVDIPQVNEVLKAIFGNDKYVVRGARGDFNLPGAPYQALHSDLLPNFLFDPAETEFPDSGRIDNRDLPIFNVVANFLLADLNELNAPIRQIPMTQNSHRPMPLLDDEPLWMKRSTLCPATAGSVIFRDPRAWHGGTPNLSDGVRMMPNIEYYAYWYRYHDNRQMTKSLPRTIYETLSPYAQKLCTEVVMEDEGGDFSMKDDIAYIYGDVKECYYKLGLTEEDLEAYRSNGAYWDSTKTEGTWRYGFYGRKNETVNQEESAYKDEL